MAIAARMPMMMMTTRSSMSVKPSSRSSIALRMLVNMGRAALVVGKTPRFGVWGIG